MGPGELLPAEARAFFEPRFGHDFSRVRIHAASEDAASAAAVNARAYTLGHHIVFGAGQYAPHTPAGQRLIAHELAHVIQQGATQVPSGQVPVEAPGSPREGAAQRAADRIMAGGAADVTPGRMPAIQRDLATPVPEPAPAAQPDLTEDEIKAAIRFNRDRYDRANTQLIQDILGGPVTGEWTRDNILSIAATQEEYGLKKDGKVGPDTFRFIVNEQRLEGVDTTDQNCLTMFRVRVFPTQSNATAGPNGTTVIRGHHIVDAQFSSRCNCSQYQYRQFITGVATGFRGAASQDLGGLFVNIPGGQLPAAFAEDGMTQCPGVNYGHRNQPAQASTTAQCGENRYTNDAGATDQANGCTYRGEDFPQIEVNGLQSGDVVDLLIQFRGEIQRNGRTVQTRRWTTVDTSVATP